MTQHRVSGLGVGMAIFFAFLIDIAKTTLVALFTGSSGVLALIPILGWIAAAGLTTTGWVFAAVLGLMVGIVYTGVFHHWGIKWSERFVVRIILWIFSAVLPILTTTLFVGFTVIASRWDDKAYYNEKKQ